MTQESEPEGEGARMSEIIRLVVTRREHAPRSPRMERALKRLIQRYSQALRELEKRKVGDVQE